MFDQPCCQNPDCGLPIVVTGGHRPRKYCNNACKQAVHRARLRQAQKAEAEEARLARRKHERTLLMNRYGNLLPQTLDLLQSIEAPTLVDKIARVIITEREHASLSETMLHNALLEELLLLGEQLGYPPLKNDDFELSAGVENWLSFTESASLDLLSQARDIAYIQVQAAAGRKRLVQLAPQA
jgi:hypothetical protein